MVVAVLALLAALLASPAAARETEYKGRFLCDDRGSVAALDGMNVELWKRGEGWLPVEWVGRRVASGFTGADGSFSMTTPRDEDNYFVRMALRDAHGVHLRDFWGINDWSVDSVQKRNDRAVQNYGAMTFRTPGQSHKCAIWAGVHAANEGYRAEIGSDLPSHGVEIQADAVTGGVPFTPGTSILWPGGFPVGYGGGGDDTITRHEYGHVIRHGFDGDFGHFLGDVVTHNYLRNHSACEQTGLGFAFNEGWAEFWAGDFGPAPDCGRPGDMETEGNVAAALVELMENCAGGQRAVMVDVLRRNPGTIHSFAEFRDRLGCPLPKPVPVYVVAATATTPPPPSLPKAQADLVRNEVRAGGKRIKGLRKSLKAALRKAENPPPCLRKPCKATLKALTRPAGIKFEIAIAKIQRGAADDYDSVKEQNKLAGLEVGQLLRRDSKQEASNRKQAVRAAFAGLKDVIEAARPVFKRDSSKYTKGFRRGIAKAAARFQRAAKKGARVLPGALVLPPLNLKLPRRLPPVPPTPPTPVPGPTVQPLAATTLSFTECPANVAPPKAIEVAGNLSPARAGDTVVVTFSHPNAGVIPVLATVDAAGNWSATHSPSSLNFTGTWSVGASFAGDSTRLPASASCQIAYI
jgi:hypothetical protein